MFSIFNVLKLVDYYFAMQYPAYTITGFQQICIKFNYYIATGLTE